ncbi:MAG: monovalent cation/H(+) antiporter subunit G [Ectothiorhodospiraceae bacterium]|nr:monovalent cation/H(+) antiporter subunit G [Chromatiales bacterium]MCP5157199.1 monovalent cation/H(+) antiporter subunit G [Ectothiorhodospiraceae bacterium]
MSPLELIGGIAVLVGGLLAVVGGIGLIRFPDFYTRLHAASVTDTLATALVVLGLALMASGVLVVVKLVLTLVFLIATGPVAAHALAKAALHGRLQPQLAREAEEDRSSST